MEVAFRKINPFGQLLILLVVLVIMLGAKYHSGLSLSALRDVARQNDLRRISAALQLYADDHSRWPATTGWSKSNEGGDFLVELKNQGYLKEVPLDPLNNDIFYYRYQSIVAGQYGCLTDGYVLQSVRLENTSGALGNGRCFDMDWLATAPIGLTFFGTGK
ncbi:MAG: hypothetical protein NUV82_03730 [Candidatus Komeilibacteria bacterium]|nr:hypothetical protein [Candidatus Komeilibacteria bacterium]